MTAQIPVETLRPVLHMFTEEQVKAIHHTTLDILSHTGIVMKNEAARKLLLDAGATETDDPSGNPERRRIKIPPYMVTDALAAAPSRIPMHDRLGRLVMPLEAGKVYFGMGSDCIFTHDIDTGERRKTVLADVTRFARLGDALSGIDFIMSMANPDDVPAMDVFVHEFIEMVRGSVKPNVYTANNREDMVDIHRIAAAIAGGEAALREKPFMLLYAEPISPLLYNDESVDKLMFCAEKGIPVTYLPSPNTGGGGPITVAGALALGNAECLAGLVIAQLVRRGTPFLYGMNIATLDLRSTIVSYGCPEWVASMPAWVDMARFYNLPVWGAAGATDSKVVDAQAGSDAALSIMSAYLSRCNLVHDVGYIEFGSTSSMEMVVLCDEIIREVGFVTQGVEVSERTLAREAIHRVAAGSGFLADDHTLEHYQWAQWRPSIIDRSRHERWAKRGSKDIAARARDRALELLATHEVPPLSEAAERVIAEVLAGRAAGRN